ncbi:MAG: polysaccharide deacetylase family protein [Prevotella sp.]|nr:polysaccharide deacetylase family protein [Prevotella sp.]
MGKQSLTQTILTLCLLCGAFVWAQAQTNVCIASYYGDREAALTFTFDDGLQEHYTEVFPRLKQLGLKASFGIIGSKVGSDWKKIPTMTWEQLREMAADGQEITSHGWQHRALLKLSGESLRYEVQHNDTVIYEHLGFFPRTYFYPGNRKTDEGVALCSQNRVGTRMFQGSFGSKRDSAWVQRTLARTLKKGEWTVWMTHGISVGYDAFPDPQLLWNTMEQVAGMQDRLWVATLHDALAYIAERDTIQLDVKQQKYVLTVTPKSPLDKHLFFHPLTLVVDGEATEAKQGKKPLPVTKKAGKTLFDFDPNGGKITIKLKD